MVVGDITVVNATSVGVEEVYPLLGDGEGSNELAIGLLDEDLSVRDVSEPWC